MEQIGQLVHSMKMGWMKVGELKKDDNDDEEDDVDQKFYSLWNDSDEVVVAFMLYQSINQILFIARFPLPRVGLFESSILKLAFPFRAIEWIRTNHV